MSVTTKEREDLEAQYGKKVVDDAIAMIDPVKKQIPERLNKDDLKALVDVWTP